MLQHNIPTKYNGHMPAYPKSTTLWYISSICKGPSSLTWLYRLPKTWDVWGICLGIKINKFLRNRQTLVYMWHTSPQTTHSKWRWGIFADGTLTDVCVVYDIYHRYTSQKIWMTANDCAGMYQVSKIYQAYTPLYRSSWRLQPRRGRNNSAQALLATTATTIKHNINSAAHATTMQKHV